jgi:hypothetical protein
LPSETDLYGYEGKSYGEVSRRESGRNDQRLVDARPRPLTIYANGRCRS